MKTNAARILERLGIAFEVRQYDIDLEDLSAERAAEKLGMAPESVFKTLVVRGEKTGVMLAVIPADHEVDLKALARAAEDRSAEMVPLAEVEPLTGYVRGSVTALGCKKAYPVFIDELCELSDRIGVSAGIRGANLILSPQDYVRAVNAKIAPIARYKNPK